MKANIGTADRTIRIIIGIALLSLLFLLDGNARYFGLIGVLPLFTAFTRFCLLYRLFGISTCPPEKKK